MSQSNDDNQQDAKRAHLHLLPSPPENSVPPNVEQGRGLRVRLRPVAVPDPNEIRRKREIAEQRIDELVKELFP